MTNYFVRRIGAINGEAKPEIWYDQDQHPRKSVECGNKIVDAHIITEAAMMDFAAQSNGFDRGNTSVIDWLDKRFPYKEPE